MALSVATGRFQPGTALNHTVTVTTGFEPKALLFWASGQFAADADNAGAHMRSVAFATSATTRRAISTYSNDASGSAAAFYSYRSDALFHASTSGAGTEGVLDLSAISTTGFTTIVDDAFTNDYFQHYLAVGGTDITNVFLGEFTEGTTSVTAPGFQGDVVVFAATGETLAPNALNRPDSFLSLGLATASAAAEQWVLAGASNNAAATMQTLSYMRSGECLAFYDANVAALNARATFAGFTASGFDLTWPASASTRRVMYLLIQGGRWKAGHALSSTTLNATVSATGTGWTPVGALVATIGAAESAAGTAADDDGWSLGAADGTTQSCAYMGDEDAQGTSDVYRDSGTDRIARHIRTGNMNGSIVGSQSFTAFTADGFDMTQSNADAAQTFLGWLAVAGEPTTATYDEAATLTADATVTVAGGLALSDSVAFAATAAFARTAVLDAAAALGLDADATVAADSILTLGEALTFAADAVLAQVGGADYSDAVVFTADGALTVAAVATLDAALALAGDAAIVLEGEGGTVVASTTGGLRRVYLVKGRR